MTCALESLASSASLSTCTSETGEGEVTPRSTSSGERCASADASPTKVSWADELEAEAEAASEADPSVEARTATSTPRPRTSTFRAVWCFERCFKDEEEPV
eukprot:CAMPEP_0170245368 /NCGR_PEP_ID=MMETSP0116_2-20130129/22469_1 /TAXON_ID=400756 /ORGANISM="Durinskia baltica, Strain CSIRO CS-38" /LENGTH=100 /DNA_ID=CAMNT_0010496241 /DNA_START=133 /DNA_END=432 /DNA_ORIENTATION=+